MLDRPLVAGVVNVTPDSFSDGGHYLEPSAAIAHAQRLADEGADLIDLGAESSRPGAEKRVGRAGTVAADAGARWTPCLSDTHFRRQPTKPEVMRAVIGAGAAMINDIGALRSPGALEAVATTGRCRVPDAHAGRAAHDAARAALRRRGRGSPRVSRRARCCGRGARIVRERIVIDPGFGFGKTVAHNFELLRNLHRFAEMGLPVIGGLGRASRLSAPLPAEERRTACGEHRCALLAVQHGATIVRVHDVAATRDALAVLAAMDGHGAARTMSRKYFGTDGVRGKVGDMPITPEFVMRLVCRGRSTGAAIDDAERRASCGPDRQGHAHLRLHARSRPRSRIAAAVWM